MPTYEYACTACGHQLEAVQRFSDDPLTDCPECGGALRKVYGAVGIVLKGSGFYKTDSRTAGAGSSRSKEKEKDKDTSGSGESAASSETKPSTKETSGSGSKSSPAAAAAS